MVIFDAKISHIGNRILHDMAYLSIIDLFHFLSACNKWFIALQKDSLGRYR